MSEEILDMPEFLERVQDDKELLLELFNIYLEDYKGKREALEAAIDAGNVEEIKNVAHSLKGASGNISAKKLRLYFMQIEDNTKPETVQEAKDLLPAIDECFKELNKRIDEVRAEYGS